MTNWYKNTTYSSWNLKTPENIYPQIDNIVNNIVDFYRTLKEVPSTPLKIGTVSFLDEYSGNNIFSDIYINNKMVEDDGGTFAKRDRDNGNIYFNIFKEAILNGVNEQYLNTLRNFLRGNLIHELSHSIDPKIVDLDKTYNLYDYLKPTEFDAYSKEITDFIKKAYQDKNNREILKDWIVSSDFGIYSEEINNILNMPSPLFQIINIWKNNNLKFYRKLRQRIANEVFYENSF